MQHLASHQAACQQQVVHTPMCTMTHQHLSWSVCSCLAFACCSTSFLCILESSLLLVDLQRFIIHGALQAPSDPGTPKQTATNSHHGPPTLQHLQPPSPSRLSQDMSFMGAAPGSPAGQPGSPSRTGAPGQPNHVHHSVRDIVLNHSCLIEFDSIPTYADRL